MIGFIKKFLNSDFTKPLNTLIDEVKATLALIKAKTDTITTNLFTATHASRLDDTISSRQANAGLTTTHAGRIDASISSRASQTSVDAIKAKTELPLAVVNPIIKLPSSTTIATEYTITLLTTTSTQEIETCLIALKSGYNSVNYHATFEVLEGSNIVDCFSQTFLPSTASLYDIAYPIKLKLGKSSTLRVRVVINTNGSNPNHGFICTFRSYTI